MTVICIMVLIYLMSGKNAEELLNKIKDVDWNGKLNDLMTRIKPYALKCGRKAARPMLQFYYVMQDEETTTAEKAMILGVTSGIRTHDIQNHNLTL